MKNHDAELERIKDLLQSNPGGMKITRIAGKLAMNRNAAAKYLDILLMTGQVEMLEHGMSKIFFFSRRTGIPTMLDLSADLILVLDKDMKIARINDNYLKFGGRQREEVLGKSPVSVCLPVISEPGVSKKLTEAFHGTDIRMDIRIMHQNEELYFGVRMTPTVFNNGTPGITVILENITGQKKNELSLLESEANFRTLFGESPVGTAVFDTAGNLLDANPEFIRNFGLKDRKEILALNLLALPGIPPESLVHMKKNKKVKFELIIDLAPVHERGGYAGRKPGRIVLGFQVAPIILKNGGSQPGYIVQVNDSDGQFRNIMDNAPDLIARFGYDRKYLHANLGMQKIFGIAPEECVGRTNAHLALPSDTALLLDNALREAFETKRPAHCEFPFAGKDGPRWYRTRLVPDFGEHGEIISVSAVTRDITLQKQARTTPDENIRLLEGILSCIDDAVILVDCRTSRIAFANSSAGKVFGHTTRDFLDKDPRLFLGTPEMHPADHEAMGDAFSAQGYYEAGFTLKRNGGEKFFGRIHFRPIYDDSGSMRNIVVVIREAGGRREPGEGSCPVLTRDQPTPGRCRELFTVPDRTGPFS